MRILFITYGKLSFSGGNSRSIFVLRALADAGYQVDVLAPFIDLSTHTNIQVLGDGRPLSLRKIQREALLAVRRQAYDVVHGVGDAVIFASRLCRWRKIRLVYDAERRFFGDSGLMPSLFWKWFPKQFLKVEKKILTQASTIFSSCSALTTDLLGLDRELKISQIEDIPIQSLFPVRIKDQMALLGRFSGRTASIVVCSLLPDNRKELRNVLLAMRKVIESIPQVSFFFKGAMEQEAQELASNLDILEHCVFLSCFETEAFLVALDMADVALLSVPTGGRYVHSEVFTLLYSPAPLVAVQDGAYGELLDEKNSIQVLPSAESISEGVIRAIREPLFSVGVAVAGRQLIADKHSFPSFKHKIRMAYHEWS